jgi:hypothetical protein
MPYFPLGGRPVTAVPDMTGRNPGNWTAMLDGKLINVSHPVYELYHWFIQSPTLAGVPTTATVLINLYQWDVTLVGQANSWDPAQPLLMTPGDTLYVMFNVPTTMTPAPTVVGWFRYQT